MRHVERVQALRSWVGSLTHNLQTNILACFLIEGEEKQRYLDTSQEFTVVLVIRNIGQLLELRKAFTLQPPEIPGLVNSLYLMTPKTLKRHLELDPYFGRLLVEQSIRVFGDQSLPKPPSLNNQERLAPSAGVAFWAFTLLTPGLLDEMQLENRRRQLQRVSIGHQDDSQGTANTRVLFYSLLNQLSKELNEEPELSWLLLPPNNKEEDRPSYFEWEKRLIVAIPHFDRYSSQDVIARMEWGSLVELTGDRYRTFHAIPIEILRYHLYFNEPASLRLRNIDHLRGPNILEDLEPPLPAVFRNLGQIANSLLIKSFPRTILAAPDGQLDTILHNYQNILLNIQLRNELLSKLEGLPIASPKKPRVPKDSSLSDRIINVLSQLDWWAGYHMSQLVATN